jgi:hypothetical protein
MANMSKPGMPFEDVMVDETGIIDIARYSDL